MANRCGFCGLPRECGEVCCLEMALHQGQLHSQCSHGPPEGLAPELAAAWVAGQRAGQERPVAVVPWS